MLGAILFIAIYHLLPLLVLAVWAPQYFLNEPEYSIRYFFIGGVSLLCFIMCFRDRKSYPLKKETKEAHPDVKRFAQLFDPEKKPDFYPVIIELENDIDGHPVTHADGNLSPIRLRAVQINLSSDTQESDYDKLFYNSKTREIVSYDASKTDHQQLYEHFLWIISQPKLPVRPYLDQFNIVAPEKSEEKRTNTVH
jgi:hypothetical protein